MTPQAIVVLTTFPDADTARRIVRMLVEEQLIACGNLIPDVESIYRWKGAIETASEMIAILKSDQRCYPKLEARLKELHPYEVPECIVLAVSGGLPSYLQWIAEAVNN